MANELMDIVDSEDRVIGQRYRDDLYAEGAKNFRVVNAFIENSRGEVLFPRRSMERKLFPGALDTSVGGHVRAGESYLQALERETFEETGLVLSSRDVTHELVCKLSPYESPVSAFMHFFVIRSDVAPTLSETEFSGFEWARPADVLVRMKPGLEKWKDDLPILLRLHVERS